MSIAGAGFRRTCLCNNPKNRLQKKTSDLQDAIRNNPPLNSKEANTVGWQHYGRMYVTCPNSTPVLQLAQFVPICLTGKNAKFDRGRARK